VPRRVFELEIEPCVSAIRGVVTWRGRCIGGLVKGNDLYIACDEKAKEFEIERLKHALKEAETILVISERKPFPKMVFIERITLPTVDIE
jgi:hypothetical protein